MCVQRRMCQSMQRNISPHFIEVNFFSYICRTVNSFFVLKSCILDDIVKSIGIWGLWFNFVLILNLFDYYIYYAAGLNSGTLAGWNAMFWNTIGFDIWVEIPDENAAICSWMYMRNVSDDHLPIFLIVLWSTLLRCIVIAPPALRLWLPTCSGCNPFLSKFKNLTALLSSLPTELRARLINHARSSVGKLLNKIRTWILSSCDWSRKVG